MTSLDVKMSLDGLSDHALARQVAAYWTRIAYESIIGFTRDEMVKRGLTQPQFWLLRHLSAEDLSADGEGMLVVDLHDAMAEYLRPEDDLDAEAAVLADRGLLRRDEDRCYWITDAGEAARLRMKAAAPEIGDPIHAGITEADYVTAMKVLGRLIANTSSADSPT